MEAIRYRLNFMLSAANYDRLERYKMQTGRSRTEVIRQLLVDFIQGFASLPTTLLYPTDGSRFDVYLAFGGREALDAVLAAQKVDVSAVINGLLDEWLPGRLRTLPESVELAVKVPVPLLNLLSQQGEPGVVLVRLATEALQPSKQKQEVV